MTLTGQVEFLQVPCSAGASRLSAGKTDKLHHLKCSNFILHWFSAAKYSLTFLAKFHTRVARRTCMPRQLIVTCRTVETWSTEAQIYIVLLHLQVTFIKFEVRKIVLKRPLFWAVYNECNALICTFLRYFDALLRSSSVLHQSDGQKRPKSPRCSIFHSSNYTRK